MAYSHLPNKKAPTSWEHLEEIRLIDEGDHPGDDACFDAASANVVNSSKVNRTQAAHKGWKPLSLSATNLSFVAILSLLIAAAIEVLAQKASLQGGLALSASQDDIPWYAMQSYLYGPNVVAVLYSLLWSWIDLDTKRLQPWFEMSRETGATAENSLFLDYPHDFVAFVPWKAAKRRHWPVFLSGTTMMIVFWAITPLQSAILGTGSVLQTRQVDIVQRSRLVPVEEQADLLGPEVLNIGYATAWLGQAYPPFMTSEYATLSFYTSKTLAAGSVGANLTATTTELSTKLDCWPAKVVPSSLTRTTFSFHNGHDCNTTLSLSITKGYTMVYAGYYSSPYSDYTIAGDLCPGNSNTTHQFLAIWAKSENSSSVFDPGFNITALYCQPRYYKRLVEVSVADADLTPLNNGTPAAGPQDMLLESEFNMTAFEYLLANGMPEVVQPTDYPFLTVVEQQPRLSKLNLSGLLSNMVGFALAGKNYTVDDYSRADILHETFNAAHKYLFSLAVNRILRNDTDFANHTATETFSRVGILVSRTFSTIVECLLFVVAMASIGLLLICARSPCNLVSNPSSISRITEILQESHTLRYSCQNIDALTDLELRKWYQHWNLRLVNLGRDGRAISCIQARSTGSSLTEQGTAKDTHRRHYSPEIPFILRRKTGVGFVCSLLALIAGIGNLQWQVSARNGLRRPTNNFEVLQLLENYIPTIIATLIEPFWVLLNRSLCVLQPFRALCRGKASREMSLDLTYTAVPPQLAVIRSLKRAHYLLAAVCSVTLLANVLAVGLGALLTEAPGTVQTGVHFTPALAATFDHESVMDFYKYLGSRTLSSAKYQDHMYIALTNISYGTALPPWTTAEYFFQPFNIPPPRDNTTKPKFSIISRGFGVHANCTSTSPLSIPVEVAPDSNLLPNVTECPDLIDTAKSRMRLSVTTRSSGLSAIEYSNTVGVSYLIPKCDADLTFGWGRTPQGQDLQAPINASFVVCRPVLNTGLFNVVVNAEGYVESYRKQSNIEQTLHYSNAEKHIQMIFAEANHLFNTADVQWHNDTLSRSWMSYLIMALTKSRKTLSPTEPLPSPVELIPVIEYLYREAFAILLSQNQHLFSRPTLSPTVKGSIITEEVRIFTNRPALIICLTILVLNVFVSILYYWRVRITILPRIPTTIGSIFAFIGPSRLLQRSYDSSSDLLGKSLSFGRYVDENGKAHIGIELDRYVIPIDPASLKAQNSNPSDLSPNKRLAEYGELHRNGPWV